MKNSCIISLLAILALYSCKQPGENYTLRLELDGTGGKWMILSERVDRKYVVFDSLLVDHGAPAILSRSVEGVQTMYLSVKGEPETLRLLMENAEYTIAGTILEPVIETNSKAQNDLNAYNNKIKQISLEISILSTELGAAGIEQKEIRDSLRAVLYELYDRQYVIDSVYVDGNPASFASVLALRGIFYKLEPDQLEEVLNALDPEVRQLEEYRYMYGKLERMKGVAIGQPFADFGLETPEGEILKVSDVHQGNVLLIDFWASWCAPCRRANPELVEIYHEYHERGFSILGVSLDRDSASWKRAIADDHLIWNNISDLRYWNNAGAVLYGVPSLPHTVLIDRNGIIQAKKLHGDALRKAIELLL